MSYACIYVCCVKVSGGGVYCLVIGSEGMYVYVFIQYVIHFDDL